MITTVYKHIAWARHVARMETGEVRIRFFAEQPQGERPFGRSMYRWEYNIKVYLKKIEWGVDWIDVAQDRQVAGFLEYGKEP